MDNPLYKTLRKIAENSIKNDDLWLREVHWRVASDAKWSSLTTMGAYLDNSDDLETIQDMMFWIENYTSNGWATTGFRKFWFEIPKDAVLFKLIWAD
jgi:hypothetical protein